MKKGIIIASFGTSVEDTRKKTIDIIEAKVKKLYGDSYEIERTFTSQMIINILKERDGVYIKTIGEAISDMNDKEVEEIFIQPLHIINGFEYEKLLNRTAVVGKPLLTDSDDYEKVTNAIDISNLGEDEAIVFMGHGTEHGADEAYEKLQKLYNKKSKNKIFVGTVEGSITIKNILEELKKNKKIKKIKLMPFMLVAGDHAINDMASSKEDSWKTILEKNGYNVEAIVKGLGENVKIQNIYLEHLETYWGKANEKVIWCRNWTGSKRTTYFESCRSYKIRRYNFCSQ